MKIVPIFIACVAFCSSLTFANAAELSQKLYTAKYAKILASNRSSATVAVEYDGFEWKSQPENLPKTVGDAVFSYLITNLASPNPPVNISFSCFPNDSQAGQAICTLSGLNIFNDGDEVYESALVLVIKLKEDSGQIISATGFLAE